MIYECMCCVSVYLNSVFKFYFSFEFSFQKPNVNQKKHWLNYETTVSVCWFLLNLRTEMTAHTIKLSGLLIILYRIMPVFRGNTIVDLFSRRFCKFEVQHLIKISYFSSEIFTKIQRLKSLQCLKIYICLQKKGKVSKCSLNFESLINGSVLIVRQIHRKLSNELHRQLCYIGLISLFSV